MSLAEVGAELRRVLDHLSRTGSRSRSLAATLSSVRERLAALTRGSRHPLIDRIQTQYAAATERLEEAASHADAAAKALQSYMHEIGIATPATSLPSASEGEDGRPDQARNGESIDRARADLPRGVRGAQTQGKWVGADGRIQDLSSGKDDEWYCKAKQFASTFPPALRAASRLTTHLEVKFAVRMREEAMRMREGVRQRETIVIDREVCGRGATDQTLPFTCDKMLQRFLPPGAELTVVEHDGTRRTYRGEGTR